MCRDKGAGFQDLLGVCAPPFADFWNCEERTRRGVEARHLVRVAQTAILTGLFLMPMDQNKSQAQHHQDCEGASKQREPAANHACHHSPRSG